jgi:hypothetical protein
MQLLTDKSILWLAGDHGICMQGEPASPDRDDYTFTRESILSFARELLKDSQLINVQEKQ